VRIWCWLVEIFERHLILKSLVIFPELLEWWDIKEVGNVLDASDEENIAGYMEAASYLKTVASIKALPRSFIPRDPLEVRYSFLKELEPVRRLYEPKYTRWIVELISAMQRRRSLGSELLHGLWASSV